MNCKECKYCILEDYGYSNYTVEGTNADCLLDMNPHFPEDAYYGRATSLQFANECPQFTEGEPVKVDCGREEGGLVNYSDDPEIKLLLQAYSK